MFCKPEDFTVPPLNIPNVSKQGETFTSFADEHEEVVLRKIMGHELYEEFISDLTDVEFDVDSDYLDDKWKAIYNGASYEHEDLPYRYVGLKAILKPYIFAMWLKINFRTYVGPGVTIPKNENSSFVNPAYEIVTQNNKARRLIGDDCKLKNTFYGFMYVNKDATYPTWTFEAPSKKNELDL